MDDKKYKSATTKGELKNGFILRESLIKKITRREDD